MCHHEFRELKGGTRLNRGHFTPHGGAGRPTHSLDVLQRASEAGSYTSAMILLSVALGRIALAASASVGK